MKHIRCHRPDISWVDFFFRAPQYTLRFLYMSGDNLFCTMMRLFRTQRSPISGGMRQRGKGKCFNFTHRCKSLNCFKPSVTWGQEFLYIWKQRLEASNTSDKKIMNIVVIFCSLFNLMKPILLFVVLAWWQRTSMKVIVSKKLMKFLPVSVQPVQQSGCPDHWRLQKMYFNLFFFFFPLWDINPTTRKGFILSNKVRFVREPGKAKWPSWTSRSPAVWFIAIIYPF